MLIRKARIEDADRIWSIHTAAIRHACAPSYPPALIDEWTGALSPERYLEPLRSMACAVAEKSGIVAGFCFLDLRAGELHAIYVAPDFTGRGIGGRLVAWAETTARADGREELFLKATLNAVTFYERCGFHRGAATNQPLPSGTPRACIEMRKRLRRVA